MKKVLESIMNYLKDWRNLLSHAIVGVLLVVIGLALPIPAIYRVLVLFVIIGLNILRMRWNNKKGETPSSI